MRYGIAVPLALCLWLNVAFACGRPAATGWLPPQHSPEPSPTRRVSASPTRAFTPGSAPTPVPLNNPQNPISYGADASGTNDSTSSFQNAINAGDLDIQAGVYKILSSVSVPDRRNIRCEAGAAIVNRTS